TAPGTYSVAARLAEWGRDHGLGGLVTCLEERQYDRSRPAVGGLPSGGIPLAHPESSRSPPRPTAEGAAVYVGGAALSVCTLGNILKAAGAVRAMELDINPGLGQRHPLPRLPSGFAEGLRALSCRTGPAGAVPAPLQPRL